MSSVPMAPVLAQTFVVHMQMSQFKLLNRLRRDQKLTNNSKRLRYALTM